MTMPRICLVLDGFDHFRLKPQQGCPGCGYDMTRSSRPSREPAPAEVIEVNETPPKAAAEAPGEALVQAQIQAPQPQARLFGKKATPASIARTASYTKDQAVKDERLHAGSRAMHSTGEVPHRTRPNDSGVTRPGFKTVITPRHQFYDPASRYDLELVYTSSRMFGNITLTLYDDHLPEDGIEGWIREKIVDEGHNWNKIIYDPTVTSRWICSQIDGNKTAGNVPRRFANSVYKATSTQAILQACEEVRGERQLIIVCEIPDPELLAQMESPTPKKTRVRKEIVPPDFRPPFTPRIRHASNDDDESLPEVEEIFRRGFNEELPVKEEGAIDEGVKIKDEIMRLGVTVYEDEEVDVLTNAEQVKRPASLTLSPNKAAGKKKKGKPLAPKKS